MASCGCRPCQHRVQAMNTKPATSTLLDVALITLSFKSAFSDTNIVPYAALNAFLNGIKDSAQVSSHPSTFTTWSPCLSNPNTVVVLTTASNICNNNTSPIFELLLNHLSQRPSVQHLFLNFPIISLAQNSRDGKVPCDIIIVRAPDSNVAAAMGQHFGWHPRPLSAIPMLGGEGALSHPGDLVRDFWTWAELRDGRPPSRSSSGDSDHESPPTLRSTNTEEKNMALYHSDEEDDEVNVKLDEETLVMIFQWSSHMDGDRFKHPLQKSYGQNGREVMKDTWDRNVAHPLRQLQGVGAQVSMFKLELREIEDRIALPIAARGRSGSKRLSTMATEFGERVSGLWR